MRYQLNTDYTTAHECSRSDTMANATIRSKESEKQIKQKTQMNHV